MDRTNATGRRSIVWSASGGTRHIIVGTMIGAVAVYLFQVWGARVLGAIDFAPVSALWTVYFLGFTMFLLPVEQFVVRRLSLTGSSMKALRPSLPTLAGVIAGATILATSFVFVTRDRLFQGEAAFAVVTALIFASYGTFVVGRGILAGRHRFGAFGWVVGAEAVVRLLAAIALLAVSQTPLMMGVAMVVGAWVILAPRPFRRSGNEATDTGEAIADEDTTSAGRFLTGLTIGTVASQAILAAGPLVVAALGADAAAVSVFFVTFTLFRGPLTAAYNLFAKVLSRFTMEVAAGEYARLKAQAAWITGIGSISTLVVALIAAQLGPFIVELMFGREFRPSAPLAALAAAGVILAGTALFAGQVLVASGASGRLAWAWLIAVVAGVIALIPDVATPSIRVGVSFVIAEGVAVVATMTGVAITKPHSAAVGHPRLG